MSRSPTRWPSRRPGRQAGEGFASIALRPLADGYSRRLLDSLTPAGRLAEGLSEEALARAEGNPLFLEELVLHLAEGGMGALPDGLQALLAARIDALPTADKRVLQQAAVVGRVFWKDPVERALGVEPSPPACAAWSGVDSSSGGQPPPCPGRRS